MPSARERWFAEVLHAGLDTRVMSEQDILAHATPAVLTAALPRDVMVKVIETTLTSGTMSHKAIIDVVTLDLLAEKVPQNVIWACVAAAAERAGIRDGTPKDEVLAREFVRQTLAAALETGVLLPKDVVAQVNAQVLGTSLPEALTTKLLEASLAAGKMNPELILETLGVDAIAKHAPMKIVWQAFTKPGEAPATVPPPIGDKKVVAGGPAPRLEFVDDEVNNVLVELEGLEPEPTKPPDKPKASIPPVKQPARPS